MNPAFWKQVPFIFCIDNIRRQTGGAHWRPEWKRNSLVLLLLGYQYKTVIKSQDANLRTSDKLSRCTLLWYLQWNKLMLKLNPCRNLWRKKYLCQVSAIPETPSNILLNAVRTSKDKWFWSETQSGSIVPHPQALATCRFCKNLYTFSYPTRQTNKQTRWGGKRGNDAFPSFQS